MKRATLYSLLSIAFVLTFHFLGFSGQFLHITLPEQIALVIIEVTAILWITELVPLFVTSFIIILLQVVWLMPAMSAHGIDITRQAFLSPFFSDIILLFLGGFVLSATLHKYGLDQRIAKWIIGKSAGDAKVLLLLIIMISSFFSMWMSNTATTAMMFAVVMPIIRQMPKGSSFPVAMALAIPFSCNLGGLGTPIGSPPNAIALSYMTEHHIDISFLEWMMMALPVTLVLLLILWRLLLFLHPIDGEKLVVVCVEEGNLSKSHYIIILIFLLTSVGWMTTGIHGFSSGTVSLFPIIICFGFGFLNTQDFRNLSWDVLIMLGGGLSLGVALKESGLVGEIITYLPENAEMGMVALAFGVVAILMSTFISNTATANLIVPISVSVGVDPAFVTMVVAMSCSAAMALPVSTPPNAIAFGSGLIGTKQILVAGGIISLLALAAIFAADGTYWKVLGIF